MERYRLINFPSGWQDGGPWKNKDWGEVYSHWTIDQLHEAYVLLGVSLGLWGGEFVIGQDAIEGMQNYWVEHGLRVTQTEAVYYILAKRASCFRWVQKELFLRVAKI